MKRTIYSLFAAVLCCTTLSAQATFGVRVGYNSTDAKIEAGDIEIDTEGEGNLMLGIFANLPLGTNIVSIQPEINYQNRGYAINADNITLGSQTISYLDLGALARLNFNMDGPVGIYIGAGPYITYAVSGSIDDASGERDIDFDADRIKRGGLQVAGIGGVTFGAGGFNFFVEGRYQSALSDISDDDTFSIKQRQIGAAVGIMIPLGN